ncbi:hypothetical protein O6H91_19G056900 [Diphasiastrum complanatum]|uniref:Uncharacterized protein n=1 Tax=Diphasiastrum complanatum TaxID=34168 RepID=A0ACC2AW83_DIPCM|nr:hypothetical protein O6H91_19G056900 [Diphasiastrum complanatum]
MRFVMALVSTKFMQKKGPDLISLRTLMISGHSELKTLTNEHVRSALAPRTLASAQSKFLETHSLPVARRLETLGSLFIRNLSQIAAEPSNGKNHFFIDTLALVRKLEAHGLTTKQAEAITSVMTDVLNGSLENVTDGFVSQSDLQNREIMHDACASKQLSAIQNSQENRFATLQYETERLHSDLDHVRSEFRHELDKVTALQRLDLNLERGRIKDELAQQSQETSNLTNLLDKELHALKTELETAKFEVIKYCIGTIISITAVGLALLRILM